MENLKTEDISGQREGIVLAGGLGTRLRSVVDNLPKCMAPVAGRPFLYYLLRYMERQRFTRVILALGYLHEMVERWISEERWRFCIDFSVEQTPLGTGGAIKQALKQVKEHRVFVLNGDTFFDADLGRMERLHCATHADLTLALKPMTHFSRYGTVICGENGRIESFLEKQPRDKGDINGGIYLLDTDAMREVLPEGRFSFETDVLEKQLTRLCMTGCLDDGYFVDIGIPEDYVKADAYFRAHI